MAYPRKLTDEERAQVAAEYIADIEPMKAIAARYKVAISTISTTAARAGVQRKKGAQRERIIAVLRDNPSLTVEQVAEITGIRRNRVRDEFYRMGYRVESVQELGRAAREAGLTVEIIRTLAQARTDTAV